MSNQERTPAPSTPQPPAAKGEVLWTNPITIAGLLFVAIGLVTLLSFWLLMLVSTSAQNNQYLGMFGFMILPGVLVNGLAMCPVGIVLRRRRLKNKSPVWQISTRHALQFMAITFFLILPVLGVAGFRGVDFTDSADFCGTICHNMDPQYNRYIQSPHARVTCAGCHIGPGPGAFVKAKISGLMQVVYTATNTFPRPIPPAITELRPARETCEQCHWPSQFFGSLLRKTVHFAPDENNTRHEYEILVKVGGLNNSPDLRRAGHRQEHRQPGRAVQRHPRRKEAGPPARQRSGTISIPAGNHVV
jgi:nitrate/TMAO reductase-like tetraheme cytochrome c subunit